MKGIVLAGGTGSRLWPLTKAVSKQLLPIYDKPLIHYPLGTLMLAGIREILIITTPDDQKSFEKLLGNGSGFGLGISYAVQEKPNGIAAALLIGESFIKDENFALILGDNLFHGVGLGQNLSNLEQNCDGLIFAYKVKDPERYGVVEFDSAGNAISLEEKPIKPKSSHAVPGLYFYKASVVRIAKSLKPSARGELEITTLNQTLLESGQLQVKTLDRGTVWLDTGTVESLHDASDYVRVVEERQGLKICCLEEIAWRNGWITDSELLSIGKSYLPSLYGEYILKLINN